MLHTGGRRASQQGTRVRRQPAGESTAHDGSTQQRMKPRESRASRRGPRSSTRLLGFRQARHLASCSCAPACHNVGGCAGRHALPQPHQGSREVQARQRACQQRHAGRGGCKRGQGGHGRGSQASSRSGGADPRSTSQRECSEWCACSMKPWFKDHRCPQQGSSADNPAPHSSAHCSTGTRRRAARCVHPTARPRSHRESG